MLQKSRVFSSLAGPIHRSLARPLAPRARSRRAYSSTMAAAGEEASTSGRTEASSKPLLSVAPMMDWTDLHYRQLARLISKHTWLWTEMVVDKTILHTPSPDKFLWFPPEQRPLVLQLGGSDPQTLADACKVVAGYGYDEVNLNCGCPSDRVAGAGCFGAALMMQPQLVADCMAAAAAALGPSTPMSVKCRLGVDDADSYGQLAEFVRVVSERGGVQHFIIHARKCLLKGLNPAQNRTVPPLRHEWVWALKRDFPRLSFTLNGGILSAHDAAAALRLESPAVPQEALCGVMVGRQAYHDPWGLLGDADRSIFGAEANGASSRREVIRQYTQYADAMLGRWQVKEDGHKDPSLRTLVKPLLNLFHGEKGNKRWKNLVDSELKVKKHETFSQLMEACLVAVPDEVLDAPPKPARAVALALQDGREPLREWGIPAALPGLDDRAGGAESAKRYKRSADGGQNGMAVPAGEVLAQQQQQQQGGAGEQQQQVQQPVVAEQEQEQQAELASVGA